MKKSNFIVTLSLLFFAQASFAVQLSITLINPSPTTVPKYGKVSVFYKVNNITNTTLASVYAKKIPHNVTQVTCDPKYCGTTFNLGPAGSPTDSCILKLTVKGAVHAGPNDLLLCSSTECASANTPLNIALAESLDFIGINAGSYSNHHSGIFPLLATTNDSGNTWAYPQAIFKNLKNNIDPLFENGVLSSASCNESFDKNVCISAGQWCADESCTNPLPLIAVGNQQATNWHYPKSVFENLKTVVDPNLLGGSLRSSSCFGSGGNTICIAGGSYFTSSAFFPLLARSVNGGNSWTYPTSIFQNLTTTIDPNFKSGQFSAASCTKFTCDSVCIAVGNFCNTSDCDIQLPLLALSTDKGSTWSYPAAIFQNLSTKIGPDFRDGFLRNSSCTGAGNKAICTAVGNLSTINNILPLLAVTRDGGSTWNYPSEIFTNLETTIGHGFTNGILNATSCTGAGSKAICIGAGSYFTLGSSSFPLIALSRNGGLSWTYPDFIYTKLKTLVDPLATAATFDGASCIGTGKTGLCLAAGQYCRDDGSCFPLIASSTNGGKTWSYPPSVYSNLKTVISPQFKGGFFSDVSCQGNPTRNFCMASGQYFNASFESFPLVAISADSGNTWTYPSYIFQNLTSIIDPDFAIGSFSRNATSGGEIKLENVYKKFGLGENGVRPDGRH